MALLPKFVLTDLQQGHPIVDKEGKPTDVLLRTINGNTSATRRILTAIGVLLENIIDLNDLITEAEEAIDAVNGATALRDSYVSGLTITATDAGSDATITISAHTRHYPQADGTTTSVAVNGGNLTGRAYSTQFWVYYDDPGMAGGAVTYASSTTPISQSGARHSVGAVTTPAAAGSPIPGNPVRPPGYVDP